MNKLKSHFKYSKSQRNGILFLIIVIVSLQAGFFFINFTSKKVNPSNKSNDITLFLKELDSLKNIKSQLSKPKTYPYNPNFLSDYKASLLGMSVEEIDRLITFRSQNKFINSVSQFQQVTQVSDSLLGILSPNFKFPDWVNKKNNNNNKGSTTTNTVVIKKDINLATVEDLKVVKGIGDKLALRIVNYRNRLQGFSIDNQLYEVWYLDKEVADNVLNYFEIKEKPLIKKININTASFKEVLKIVYLDYELTKKIFNYRDEVAEIQNINELKKIDSFPIEKFNRITLYLQAK